MAVNYTDNYEDLVTSESFCENNETEIGRDLCRVEVFLTEERKKKERGGYKKDILTENLSVREKAVLICITCEGIMKEACISSSGQQLCSCCEDQFPSKQTPNVLVRNMINSLKCSCPLIERGCKWLGTLGSCENHLDTCDYVRETCELACGAVLIRQELRIHVKDKCPQRVVMCNHCDNRFKSCELNEHFKKCPRVKVTCDLCGVMVSREDMREHLEEYCPEKILDCPFVKYKCMLRIKRKDINTHLEEMEIKHLGLKLTAMEDLNAKQSKDINKQNEDMNKQIENYQKQYIEINGLNEDIENRGEEINKRNEKINIQNKDINKQEEEIKKQHKEITNTSKQIELLYFVTDTTKITWIINGFFSSPDPLPESQQYEVAGFSFRFKYHLMRRELSIVFPGTTFKCDRPFIAKCHIITCVNTNTLNCGIIEVKQKHLARGCERIIASNFYEYTGIYSQSNFSSLTLEIYLTMQ